MRIKFQRVDSLADEIDRLQQRIAARALEIFRARGGSLGHALEDWLRAERETVWRPAIEVVPDCNPHVFVVRKLGLLASLA